VPNDSSNQVSKDQGIRCLITEKFTTSCNQCYLYKVGPGGTGLKCMAKKGQKYKMVARPGSGEFWDTYVMTPQEIKEADASHGLNFKTVKAKGGS